MHKVRATLLIIDNEIMYVYGSNSASLCQFGQSFAAIGQKLC